MKFYAALVAYLAASAVLGILLMGELTLTSVGVGGFVAYAPLSVWGYRHLARPGEHFGHFQTRLTFGDKAYDAMRGR